MGHESTNTWNKGQVVRFVGDKSTKSGGQQGPTNRRIPGKKQTKKRALNILTKGGGWDNYISRRGVGGCNGERGKKSPLWKKEEQDTPNRVRVQKPADEAKAETSTGVRKEHQKKNNN